MSNPQAKLKRIEERLDGLEDTIEIIADKKALASRKKSSGDIRAGRYKDYSSVKQFRTELESKSVL
jgi:hypothetical protein